MMEAVNRGILPHSHVSRTKFGIELESLVRTGVRDQARLQTLGYQVDKEFWLPDTDAAARI